MLSPTGAPIVRISRKASLLCSRLPPSARLCSASATIDGSVSPPVTHRAQPAPVDFPPFCDTSPAPMHLPVPIGTSQWLSAPSNLNRVRRRVYANTINDAAFKSLSLHCEQAEKALDQAYENNRVKKAELLAERLRREQAERDGAFFNQQMLAAEGKEAAMHREVRKLRHTIAKKDKELKKKQIELDALRGCDKKLHSLKRKAATTGKTLLSLASDEGEDEAPAPKRVKPSPSEEPVSNDEGEEGDGMLSVVDLWET
ncbi:hypothetical protein BDZ45DRAFT_740963 [Acephala macrosclerotiorum]|nr:hypothetical protein BDZ45DRAFT_740963 [Acephala macrosclerotiorum]